MDQYSENQLLGFGNALLDFTAHVDSNFLTRYKLNENDAIQTNKPEHTEMFEKILNTDHVPFTAGGSVQNTLRVVQWIVKKPKVCTLIGSVGRDRFAQILKDLVEKDGVNVHYSVRDDQPTGLCASLINGTNRSLCANLGASLHFDETFLDTVNDLIESARFFYTAGFFLIVNRNVVINTCKRMARRGRAVLFNLGAPYVINEYANDLSLVVPYVDVVFGNITEARLFVKNVCKRSTSDMTDEAIVTAICQYEKITLTSRVVVVTNGPKHTLCGVDGLVTRHDVIPVPGERINDTNGAGDAFAGGFISKYILNRSLNECVECGLWAASQIIQSVGCSFPIHS